MKNRRVQRNGNRGISILHCFVLISLISLLIAGLLGNEVQSAQLLKRELASSQAYYLAESGLIHSLSLLKTSEEGTIFPTALGRGSYSVSVSPNVSGDVRIQSIGSVPVPPSGEATREIVATVSKSVDGRWIVVSRAES